MSHGERWWKRWPAYVVLAAFGRCGGESYASQRRYQETGLAQRPAAGCDGRRGPSRCIQERMEVAPPTVRYLPGSGIGICARLDVVTRGKLGGGVRLAVVARAFAGAFFTAEGRTEHGARGEQNEAKEEGRPSTHV